MQIRPVSDLRNKFSEIENIVSANRSPVFLTKNGYGSMVVMSLDLYESLTHTIESQLNEADTQAASTNARLSHEEVFSHIRSQIKISWLIGTYTLRYLPLAEQDLSEIVNYIQNNLENPIAAENLIILKAEDEETLI